VFRFLKPEYLPFTASGGALLFHLRSNLYQLTDVIIITNLSFSAWVVHHWTWANDASIAYFALMPNHPQLALPPHPLLTYLRDRK
jgi:hypothetical protein